MAGTSSVTGLAKALPVVGTAVSFLPEVFRFFQGSAQKRAANRINPVNPGFVANSALIDNARVLGERSSNYSMPGYNLALNNINQSADTAFNNGVQGASSGGDVLDLATKINYGTGQNLNTLATENAVGADRALQQYISANAMAGNELVRKNQFDLDQYNRKLQEKAALLQAGNQNQYGALDAGADAVRSFTQPQQQIVQPGATGGITPYGSIYGSTTPDFAAQDGLYRAALQRDQVNNSLSNLRQTNLAGYNGRNA